MMKPLRDNRSLPAQLAEVLRARITSGEWAPGEQLPSEQALAEGAGISRPTVRSALRLLAASGLVRVRQGVGTFVTSRGPGVVAGLQELRSMSEIIAEQRSNSTVNYRLCEARSATAEEAAYFDAEPPFKVIAIERSFMSGDEVIALEWSFINAELLTGLDPAEISGSIFAILETRGLLPDQAIATVHAVNDESIAWPELASTSSCLYLCLTQQSYLPDHRVIAWSKTYFTEGNFEFLLVRSR
jgi:GntR family transcriptional regulator